MAHPTGGGGRQGWPATWRHWSRRTGSSYSAPHQPGAAPRAASRRQRLASLVDSRRRSKCRPPNVATSSIAALPGPDDCCCSSGHFAADTGNGAAPVQGYGIVLRYDIYMKSMLRYFQIYAQHYSIDTLPPKLQCKEKLRTHDGGKELTSHFKAFPRPTRQQNKLVPDSPIVVGCFMSYTGNTESILTSSLGVFLLL